MDGVREVLEAERRTVRVSPWGRRVAEVTGDSHQWAHQISKYPNNDGSPISHCQRRKLLKRKLQETLQCQIQF